MRKKFGEDRTCSSEDMIAGRQTHTHTDRQTRSLQYSAPTSGGGVITQSISQQTCIDPLGMTELTLVATPAMAPVINSRQAAIRLHAAQRFFCTLTSPGSLLCYVIKREQPQKSLNLSVSWSCANPLMGARNYMRRGSLSTVGLARGVQLS